MPNENNISRRGLFMKLGILFNGWSRPPLPCPSADFFCPRLRADARTATSPGYLSAPSANSRKARPGWPRSGIPSDADRRQDRGHCLLGAAHRRRTIPGLRRQLRAPRLSGSLVSAIRPVHVPVPWRGILPRWLARLGPAGARSFRISVQSGERPDHHSGRRIAHAGARRVSHAKGNRHAL